MAKKKLTTCEVANAIGSTTTTVMRYADRGHIPHETIQIGPNNVRLFDPDVIPIARALLRKNIARNQKRTSPRKQPRV